MSGILFFIFASCEPLNQLCLNLSWDQAHVNLPSRWNITKKLLNCIDLYIFPQRTIMLYYSIVTLTDCLLLWMYLDCIYVDADSASSEALWHYCHAKGVFINTLVGWAGQLKLFVVKLLWPPFASCQYFLNPPPTSVKTFLTPPPVLDV